MDYHYAPQPQRGRKGVRHWGIIWGLVIAGITTIYGLLKNSLDLTGAQGLVFF
jgi:hypothetical protein